MTENFKSFHCILMKNYTLGKEVFGNVSYFPNILSLKSFSNSWGNLSAKSSILVIKSRFSCVKWNFYPHIVNCQNILNRVGGINFLSKPYSEIANWSVVEISRNFLWKEIIAELIHDRGPYHTENNPLIQWTGFSLSWKR